MTKVETYQGIKRYEKFKAEGLTDEEAKRAAGFFDGMKWDDKLRLLAGCNFQFIDIAARAGATPKVIIEHLIERAGLKDRDTGALRAIATKFGVEEHPDDRAQLDYLKELIAYISRGQKTEKTIQESEQAEQDKKPERFSIVVNVVQNNVAPKQEQQAPNQSRMGEYAQEPVRAFADKPILKENTETGVRVVKV